MRKPSIQRFFALLLACCFLAVLVRASADVRPVAVLLYDGKLPDQIALEALVRSAVEPNADKVELRPLHAGRAESVPFLKRHGFTRKNTPLLLLMDGAGPEAKIRRKVYLDPARDSRQNVRLAMSVLKLPTPVAEHPKPGPLVTVVADGGAEELKRLASSIGNQQLAEGGRKLETTGAVVYRLRLPDELRYADLRAEVAGSFAVDWADTLNGPWTPLADSRQYFGVGLNTVTDKLSPAVKLDPILEKLTGDLFLRVYSVGRNAVLLTRLAVVARDANSESAEREWLTEVARLRKEALATVTPNADGHHQIGGRITANTTLLAADSPYLLNSDLTIAPTATLTIEAGTTVRVPQGIAIRVQGQLIAKGTAKDPIQFLAAAPKQSDDWKGILFAAPRERASGERSVLEYCRVVNATTVELNRFGGEISHCILENGLAGITLRNGGTGRIHHNRFLRCRRGLVVQGGAGEVTLNEWVSCSTAIAVSAQDLKLPLHFERNSVLGNSTNSVTYFKVPGQTTPPLLLPNNHWGTVSAAKLVSGGDDAATVVFEPTLEAPPAGSGPGW